MRCDVGGSTEASLGNIVFLSFIMIYRVPPGLSRYLLGPAWVHWSFRLQHEPADLPAPYMEPSCSMTEATIRRTRRSGSDSKSAPSRKCSPISCRLRSLLSSHWRRTRRPPGPGDVEQTPCPPRRSGTAASRLRRPGRSSPGRIVRHRSVSSRPMSRSIWICTVPSSRKAGSAGRAPAARRQAEPVHLADFAETEDLVQRLDGGIAVASSFNVFRRVHPPASRGTAVDGAGR